MEQAPHQGMSSRNCEDDISYRLPYVTSVRVLRAYVHLKPFGRLKGEIHL